MKWNVPTTKNAQESFQSVRVPVSQAGTCSDCVWTSETRNGAKKAAGEQGGIWALPPRHLPVSWGSPRDLVGIIAVNFPWGNRKRGLGMKMDKPSLYGILCGFWIEMTGTIYWGPPMSVVPDWGELALGNIWQGLEGFGLLQLGMGANDTHWVDPGMLLNITQCTGQIPTVKYDLASNVNSAWGWVLPYCLLLTAVTQSSGFFMYLPFLFWFLMKRNFQAHTHSEQIHRLPYL